MLYRSIDILFQLLGISIGDKDCSFVSSLNTVASDDISWTEVINLALAQNVGPLALDAVDSLPEGMQPDKEILLKWIGDTLYSESLYESQWAAAKELGSLCANSGINCFVMKGFSLSSLYPVPRHRICGDLDCYCTDDYGNWRGDILDKLIEAKGIQTNQQYYKNSSFNYKGLSVENHRHVLPVRGNRIAKSIEFFLLDNLFVGTPQTIEDSNLFSPSELFISIHTLAHAQEHFFEDGILLRHVTDWAMCLKRLKSPGLWEKWKVACEEFGLLQFGYSMSRLASQICKVNIPFDCPNSDTGFCRRNDDYLLKDILKQRSSSATHKTTRRIQLLSKIFKDSWKFRYFYNNSAFSFAFGRIIGYLFE